MEKEIRAIDQSDFKVETRADGKKVITGYAIRYNVLSQNLGWFREQIHPNALDEADMSDVVALYNHDPNIVLGRSSAGTLKLEKRADGLYYEITPPDTQAARDLLTSIERRDVQGSSFGFQSKPGGSDWDTDPATGGEVRTVKKIARLFDISPVTYPAYLQTDTGVAKRSYEEFKKTQKPADTKAETEARERELFFLNNK